MYIIEPCCVKKQLLQIRDKIKNNGITVFEGYDDMSLTELLPALLTRYSETEMMIVAPELPNQAAKVIKYWMKKQWARSDGKGKLNVIEKLTIITNLDEKVSPMASEWLKENPFDGRLVLVDHTQADTAILLPDLVISGPVNLQYGRHFFATITTRMGQVPKFWEWYRKLAVVPVKEQSVEDPSSSEP